MKKLIAALLTFLNLATADALPVGNPWDARLLTTGVMCQSACDSCKGLWNAWSLRIGFYGDYVFNRHTQLDHRDDRASIHSTKIFTSAGLFILNFCDRFDVFGTVGGTSFKLETRAAVLGGTGANSRVFFETATHLSWSLGVRAAIWEWGCFGVGAEAQYFQTKPHPNFIRGEDDSPFYFSSHHRVKYQEWQAGLGISAKVPIGGECTALVPYAAVKWDRVHVRFDTPPATATFDTYTLFNLENERDWGYAVGLTLVGDNKASLCVEGRFADEQALFVNSQFRF
jgi:major outer membrane protein